MAKVIKQCLVCGKDFEVCNTCSKYTDEVYQWRRVVCCPEHFAYHLPIIQYVRKQITKDEAKKELLSAIDAYGEVNFADNIKPTVAEILAEDAKPKRKRSKKGE